MELEDLYYYDETSPSGLRRKTDYRSGKGHYMLKAKAGDATGSLSNGGYYTVVGTAANRIFAHTVVWELNFGSVPNGYCIDHINGVKTDNRVSNLRLVTFAHNMRNKGMYSTNKTGYTGVTERVLKGKTLFTAYWGTADKGESKSFSVNKYGYEAAKQMAIEYRAKMIAELNAQGACYTERHGKSKDTPNA